MYRVLKWISILFMFSSWIFMIIYAFLYTMTKEELEYFMGKEFSSKAFILSSVIIFFLGFISYNIASYKLFLAEKEEFLKRERRKKFNKERRDIDE